MKVHRTRTNADGTDCFSCSTLDNSCRSVASTPSGCSSRTFHRTTAGHGKPLPLLSEEGSIRLFTTPVDCQPKS
jgi:hypothetical protein